MKEKDTFEFDRENRDTVLEEIEWDDIWIQQANDKDVKRILTIGDSISRGFRPFLNIILNNNNTVVDMLASSKSVDSSFYKALIDYTIMQQPACESIFLNIGLHGFHLSAEEYGKGYEKLVRHLLENYPDKRVAMSTLIPLREAQRLDKFSQSNDTVKARNIKIKELAEKYDLPVVDLYDAMANRMDIAQLSYEDGVHFNDAGYKFLAECVADFLTELQLQNNNK